MNFIEGYEFYRGRFMMLIAIIILSWLILNNWYSIICAYIVSTENHLILKDLFYIILFSFIAIPYSLITFIIYKMKNKMKDIK